MKKDEFLAARKTISRIEDLLTQADDLFQTLPLEIRNKTWDYHRHYACLGYCLRWGLTAATDLRKDWHNVVSDMEVTE